MSPKPPRPEHLRRIRHKMSEDGVCSIEEARLLIGTDPHPILEFLKDSGLARLASKKIYYDPRLEEDDPRILAALQTEAAVEKAGRRVIERISSNEATPSAAILRLWEPAEKEDRPSPSRVYFSLAGYPPFYAQQIKRLAQENDADVRWDSAHHTLGPKEAEILGRSVFPSANLRFSHIIDALGGEREREIPIPDSAQSCFEKEQLPAPVSPHMHHMMPCAYVVSDAEALDPTKLKHPLPDTVTLKISDCQPAVMVNNLRKVPNLSVCVTERSPAHFTVPGRLVVSRLTADDFEDMLNDGPAPLIELAETLADTGLHRSLIIEGGTFAARTFPLARLASTLSYLQNVHRIHLIPTMNFKHSAYALVQTVKHSIYGLTEDALAKGSAIPMAERPASITAQTMLRAIPGISLAKANAIAATFPDLKSIALATRADLLKVEGIGPSLAKAIEETFASPLRERGDG